MRKIAKFSKVMPVLFFLFSFIPLNYVSAESKLKQEKPILLFARGRLALESLGGEEKHLFLHAKNGETFAIKGNLTDKLKSVLQELGEKNMVFVSGIQDNLDHLYCHRSNTPYVDAEQKKRFKVEIMCYHYNDFDVGKIIEAKQSDEEVPPPKRDAEEEERLRAMPVTGTPGQPLVPPVIGQITGTITALNFKGAIRTIEITNVDKNDSLGKITLIIGPSTRIGRSLSGKEPTDISTEGLSVNQTVTAMYRRGEDKSEALTITVTSE